MDPESSSDKTPVTVKREPSANNAPPNGGVTKPSTTSATNAAAADPKKDRYSRACLVCRQRKVKCDAAQCYPNRCTNCVQFNIKDCFIPAPKKRKSKKIEELLKSNIHVQLDIPPSPTSSSSSTNVKIEKQITLDQSDHNRKLVFNAKDEKYSHKQIPHERTGLSRNPSIDYPSFVIPDFQVKHPELSVIKLDPSVVFSRNINSIENNAEYFDWLGSFTGSLISNYIKCYENNGYLKITRTGYDHLLSSGCFDLPDIETCWKYINAFFTLRLCQYPVISEATFRKDFRDLTNPPSLLLLQAMLYCGARFYGEPQWTEEEKINHLERIDVLHSRAKVCFDQRIESDSLAELQAILLIGNYKNLNGYNIRADFSYLRLSLDVCYSLGIHKNPDSLPNVSPLNKKIYKRIWWSIFTVDTLFAFIFCRPWAIDKLFVREMPLITVEDLLDDPATATSEDEFKALYFVQRTRLILCIRKICEKVGQLTYDPPSWSYDSDHFTECDQMLREWIEQLPTSLLFRINSPTNNRYNANLSLEYYSVLLLLHRIYIMRSYSTDKKEQIYPSWGIVFKAAHMVAVIARYIMDNELISFSQMICAFAMNIAGMMMLYHLYNKDKGVNNIAREDIEIFLEILNRVSFTYPHIRVTYFYLKSLYEDKSKQATILNAMLNGTINKAKTGVGIHLNRGDSSNVTSPAENSATTATSIDGNKNGKSNSSKSTSKTLTDKKNETLNRSGSTDMTDVPVNSILYHNNLRGPEILNYNSQKLGKPSTPIPFISAYGNSPILPIPQPDTTGNTPTTGLTPLFPPSPYNPALPPVSSFVPPIPNASRDPPFLQYRNASSPPPPPPTFFQHNMQNQNSHSLPHLHIQSSMPLSPGASTIPPPSYGMAGQNLNNYDGGMQGYLNVNNSNNNQYANGMGYQPIMQTSQLQHDYNNNNNNQQHQLLPPPINPYNPALNYNNSQNNSNNNDSTNKQMDYENENYNVLNEKFDLVMPPDTLPTINSLSWGPDLDSSLLAFASADQLDSNVNTDNSTYCVDYFTGF